MSTITLKNLTMRFGSTTALDNVSFTFEENKIYGLLGRNGAGKSTMLNLITNKLFPTEGEVLIDGENVKENDKALSKVYCMSEKNLFPDQMKVSDVFKWTKEFYPAFDAEYANYLSEKFELNVKKRVKALSTGYASIYKVVAALASGAPIILFDEPVLGLDANHRDIFYRELIQNYSRTPRTYVISTHLIEEAADLIEKTVILKSGKLVLDEDTDALLSRGYTVSGPAPAVDTYTQGKELLGADTLGGLKTAYILGEVNRDTVPAGLEVSKLDLQKLFIKLTDG